VYTPRDNYFPSVPEVDEEEQRERSIRSREANDRRAVGRARDHAKETDCRVWVSATFDDLHIDLDTVAESRRFLSRLSKQYQRQTGKSFHYVCVVAVHDARKHLHALMSSDIDPQLIRDSWEYGAEVDITLIEEAQIEEKVGYMFTNVASERAIHGRFLRSRGGRGQTLDIPVNDFHEGREVLQDLIYPEIPRLRSAQPFGGHPRVTFQFPSIRDTERN
jgi:hypothetical protein